MIDGVSVRDNYYSTYIYSQNSRTLININKLWISFRFPNIETKYRTIIGAVQLFSV